MIKVRIIGTDRNEHNTTALVDRGASENFVDKAYAKASGIPIQQKATPRRVLTMDGSEVTSGPVTHDAKSTSQSFITRKISGYTASKSEMRQSS